MMKRKLILTGAALSLAVAMTGCGGKPVINQQPSSQEKNAVDTQAQTEATAPAADFATTQSSAAATAQTVTGTVDEEMAQKIALEHAGVKATDATITKSKLDYEGRRQVYEIEWYVGGKKYDYEIAVDTGEILSSGYDEKTSGWSGSNSSNVTVSEADAKQTALGRVSGATQKDIYEWKLDYDDGRPEYEGKIITGEELNEKMGWKPIHLASKEGLALLNGTQNMLAFFAWSVLKAQDLSKWADLIATMSLDAFDGRIEPFLHPVHAVRPHRGQMETADHIYELLQGSELIKQHKTHVQDPYSFRCIPQVHGAFKDTLHYVEEVCTTEMNSATDNPTVVPEEDMIISAGNFHGEPIALPMDFLAIALNELGSISERRIYKLGDEQRGLPSMLVAKPGVNSGFMITQYAAASIVSQSKMLCMPNSADSIPTCQGQEDHVSMGANAATKLYRVAENTERVLALELFNAAQALDFRRPLKSSPAVEKLHAEYRKIVPFIEIDRVMYPLIAKSIEFIAKNQF